MACGVHESPWRQATVAHGLDQLCNALIWLHSSILQLEALYLGCSFRNHHLDARAGLAAPPVPVTVGVVLHWCLAPPDIM